MMSSRGIFRLVINPMLISLNYNNKRVSYNLHFRRNNSDRHIENMDAMIYCSSLGNMYCNGADTVE